MSDDYHYDQLFDQQDFNTNPLPKGSYEACTFKSCNLESADLAHYKFSDCEFADCNLSLANISDVIFQDVSFAGCKMLGLHFEHCNTFGFSVSFKKCTLNDCSFYQRKLKGCLFDTCDLKRVDFGEADLKNAKFLNCDLSETIFDQTNLTATDFRTAFNFEINPNINTIKDSKFSNDNVRGLLSHLRLKIE